MYNPFFRGNYTIIREESQEKNRTRCHYFSSTALLYQSVNAFIRTEGKRSAVPPSGKHDDRNVSEYSKMLYNIVYNLYIIKIAIDKRGNKLYNNSALKNYINT